MSLLPTDIFRWSTLGKNLTKILVGYIFPTVWTSTQSHVIKRIREGRNVFFTGSAGTGKTILLRHIIEKSYLLRELM